MPFNISIAIALFEPKTKNGPIIVSMFQPNLFQSRTKKNSDSRYYTISMWISSLSLPLSLSIWQRCSSPSSFFVWVYVCSIIIINIRSSFFFNEFFFILHHHYLFSRFFLFWQKKRNIHWYTSLMKKKKGKSLLFHCQQNKTKQKKVCWWILMTPTHTETFSF